jgi:alpha-ketoglutaric semialdehyde dehydrogenase
LKERKEKIAQDLAAAVTLGVGQFCTNPGLVFVPDSPDSSAFKEALSTSIKGVSAGVMLTSGIQGNFKKGIEKLSAVKGVEVLAQGPSEGTGSRGAAHLLHASIDSFLKDHTLEEEVFGPSTLAITANTKEELIQAAKNLGGHITATLHGTDKDLSEYADLIAILEQKVGRLIINGYPTGVEVCHSMVHGGPFPATTDSRSTSVGTGAITRFTRPVCYQNFPTSLLPAELQKDNPLGIWRLVNGERRKE